MRRKPSGKEVRSKCIEDRERDQLRACVLFKKLICIYTSTHPRPHLRPRHPPPPRFVPLILCMAALCRRLAFSSSPFLHPSSSLFVCPNHHRLLHHRPPRLAPLQHNTTSPFATHINMKQTSLHAYSLAPMMDVTDRHFRALCRIISKHCVLYTEMLVDRTLIHNHKLRNLELTLPKHPTQSPVVLQLGGSDVNELAMAAQLVKDYGYTEINLNCGCPSQKVAGKGCFGAALMKTPLLVAQAVNKMKQQSGLPITVKCRIGVDDYDSWHHLEQFVKIVHEKGPVDHFIIHARKALLAGLSPAQNRSIPPLRYDVVYKLVKQFPHIRFSINGGIHTVDQVMDMLQKGLYGVMVGRAIRDQPWKALSDVDPIVYNDWTNKLNRRQVIHQYIHYAEHELIATKCSIRSLVKPCLNLFHGEKNGKRFRRIIDEQLRNNLSIRQILETACQVIPNDILDSPSQAWQNYQLDQMENHQVDQNQLQQVSHKLA